MSDLGTLADYAPISAAGFIGNNEAQNSQTQALEQQRLQQVIQGLQQENDFNAQNNPTRLQTNLADLTQKQLANQSTQATQPGTIAATNSGNQLKVAQNTSALAADMQGRLMRIGSQVSSAPAPLRMQAFTNALQQEGIDPNHPLAQSMIAQLQNKDPNTFNQYIKGMADNFGQIASLQDTHYRGEVESANIRGEAEKASAGITAAAHVKAAEILGNSRVQAATARSKAGQDFLSNWKAGKVPPDRAAVSGQMLAKMTLDEANNESDPNRKAQLISEARNYAQIAAGAEQMMYNRAQAGAAGRTTVTPQGTLGQNPQPQLQVANDPVIASLLKGSTGGPAADTVRVMHPNGKTGTIPASQLQDALKAGYKQVQ